MRAMSIPLGAVRQGVVGVALRGLWAAGKAGKVAMPVYKTRYAAGASPLETFDAGAALVVIGNRHSKLRAEVGKVLETSRTIDPEGDPGTGLTNGFSILMSAIYKLSMDEPEALPKDQRATGARMVVGLTSRLPPGSAHRYDRAEDVPDDLAFGILAAHRGTFLSEHDHAVTLATCLPWLARAEPEQLYLPRAFLQAIDGAFWVPRETIRVLRVQRRYYGDDLRAPPPQDGPSRSGPCPCGSGKKYKRCCGQDARGQVP